MRRAIALSKLVNGQNTRIVNRLFKEVHQALGGNVLLFISGGAPIDPLVVEDFNAMGLPMIQGYGMTENAPIIAVNKDKYNKPASVGLPMPGTEVRIINEDGSGIGEIICRGDSVMLGYYDDPEETARVLADGWLHTEDFGYFDSDGFLYVTGRKKNLIIAKNGKNVSPEELEYFLCKIPYIAEVMVWGADDERGGDVVICADIFPDFAYAAEACGKPPGRDELKRILKKEIDGINEKLPGYKRIRRFALRDSEFEKTTVQKIKRHTVVHGSREPAKEPGGYMNKGGMYRMAVQDDYAAVKAREKAEADALIAEIQKNTDPRVRYKDVRAVTDMRHMLEESVALYADRTAFHVKDVPAGPYRQISYRQMKQDVDALGTALAAQGLRRVAVIGENCYQWAISYLAVACGGGVIVPLDKELNASELKQLLIASEAECVLFTKKFRKIFTDIHASGDTKLRRLIDLTGEEASVDVLLLADCMEEGRRLSAEGNRAYADARISGDEMCSLIFTSGTTGVAKGVMLSHKNLAAGLMIPPTVIRIAKEDIFFSVLPIHHSYECTCGFLIPLYRGASIAYCEGLKYIVKNLAEARPTVLLAVPLILESLYKKIWQNVKASGKEKLLRRVIKINAVTKKLGIDLAPTFFKQILELFGGRMKLVICGGAAIDPAILQGLRDFGICAFQGYGLTECSPICAVNPDSAIKNSAAGYLAPGFDAKIIGADAETGIGEICVKGPHVMLGYYGNKEATDEVLKDGWFCTGDLGYVDDERYVHITGRKKNVIITKNGKNVYPEELEYYLGRIDAVSECMVWGMDSEQSGETLIVAGIRPDEDALRAELGERYTEEQVEKLLWSKVDSLNAELALFKRIRRIIVRKREFEMTTGKKIKRFVEENKGV
jgi:long-subunit acyl-CoA synthetase (AMP-forming)